MTRSGPSVPPPPQIKSNPDSFPANKPEALLAAATARHVAGDLPGARPLYEQLLIASPSTTTARFRLGLLELQENRPDLALALMERAIAESPAEIKFQLGLGEVLSTLLRWDAAASAYRRAIDLDPYSAAAHFGLALALQSMANYTEAIDAYQTTLQFQPDHLDALNNSGNCHRLIGDNVLAESAYRRALSIKPDYASAASNLGTLLRAIGQGGNAIALLQIAVHVEPTSVAHRINLGILFFDEGKLDNAEASFRVVLDLDANSAEAHFNLGLVMQRLGKGDATAEHFRKAVELKPDYADAWLNLGNIYNARGQSKLAGQAYQTAIATKPGFVQAINNMACLLRKLGRLQEAESMLRKAIQTDPEVSILYDTLGNVLKDLGDLRASLVCFRKAVELDPSNSVTHSNLVYTMSFDALNAAPILQECRRWNERHAAPLHPKRLDRPVESVGRKRLRIGYVSPYFREHCQSLFTMPLLSNHDHEQFEIFCYSSVENDDACTHRLRRHADVWRDVAALDDVALCDLIRADQLDIVVDLTMHMGGGRPLLFARRVSPVQVAWLAYPGTTGISQMDYRFSDPRLDPPGVDDQYSEQTLRLPDAFWCYDPLTDQPQPNSLPAMSTGCLTLGCLNNPCKLNDHTVGLWGAVLRELNDSRLLLMVPPGEYRQRLLSQFAEAGIDAERISFVPHQSRDNYLRTYHRIDLGLDTFPYNGHTTSLDSFWMGVPVVTRVGQTCVGRGGLSQLFQLNLKEFAAETDKLFVSKALAVAKDLPALASLRGQLRSRLAQSPLMDGPRFARSIEAAYRKIAKKPCAITPHESLSY